MKRLLVALVLLAVAGGAVWYFTGGRERLVERRVTAILEERGMPRPMAECMGKGLSERLTLVQMRKLERLAPEQGEADVPLTVPDMLERLRRVEDPQVVRTALTVSATCALDFGI